MSRDGLVVNILGAIPAVNVRISIIGTFAICDSKVKGVVSVEAVRLAVDMKGKLLERFNRLKSEAASTFIPVAHAIYSMLLLTLVWLCQ